MLNENQKRALSITLRIVEEKLRDIERVLESSDDVGVLYEMKQNISPAVKNEVFKEIVLIKERIKALAEKFDLRKESTNANKEALRALPYCWEILEDAKARGMKRYGSVADGLKNILDPQLSTIIDLILKIEHLL